MPAGTETPLEVARRIAGGLAARPEIEAIALAGSHGAGAAGPGSDLDLYVYATPAVPLAARAAAMAGSPRAELDNRFFEPGDEWVDAASGLQVDVMYRTPAWIEDQLDRVLLRHEASVGYSTAFWQSVHAAVPLFDRRGWLARLRGRAAAPYPEPLRRAIVAKNHPLLRGNLSSFRAQLEKAAARGDRVSLNHRAAAFLASFFDVLFALNRALHPGEKRLVALAEARCPLRPARLAEDVAALLAAAGAGSPEVVARVDALGEALDALLRADGLLG